MRTKCQAIIAAATGLLVGLAVPHADALTITPFFDPVTIGGAPNAAAIISTVDEAIGIYESLFTDPGLNVNIGFSLVPGAGGQSLDSLYQIGYPQYTTALANNATATGNAIQRTAVASLPFGNKAQAIFASSADLRALGIGAAAYLPNVVAEGPALDGTIGLGAGLDFSRPILPGATDGQTVAEHEMDEVLGVGGPGSIINFANSLGQKPPPVFNFAPFQIGLAPGAYSTIGDEDPFRYRAFHAPSLTANPRAASYFSINAGAAPIARFNQGPAGDYADWFGAPQGAGCVLAVQNWNGCIAGRSLDVTAGSPETRALTAIGYDPAALPLRPGPIVTPFARPNFRRFGSPQPAFVLPFSDFEAPPSPTSDALQLGILGRPVVTTFLNQAEEANGNWLEDLIRSANWVFPAAFWLADGDALFSDFIAFVNAGPRALILYWSDPPGFPELPLDLLDLLPSSLGPLDMLPQITANADGSFTIPSPPPLEKAPEPAAILVLLVGLSGVGALRWGRLRG